MDIDFGKAGQAANTPTGELRRSLEKIGWWHKASIIEIAYENQSVSDYMQHWESRALLAEARVAALSTWIRKQNAAYGYSSPAFRDAELFLRGHGL